MKNRLICGSLILKSQSKMKRSENFSINYPSFTRRKAKYLVVIIKISSDNKNIHIYIYDFLQENLSWLKKNEYLILFTIIWMENK